MKENAQRLWSLTGRTGYYLLWPIIWLILHHTARTRVIIVSDNKVLLVRGWLSPGQYSLPGGGIRHGEEPEEGAVREVYEETGIKLRIHDLNFVRQIPARENAVAFSAIVFRCSLNGLSTQETKRSIFISSEWMPLNRLQQNPSVNEFTKQALQAREL